MFRLSYRIPAVALAAMLFAACSSVAPPPAYRSEAFDVETPFQFHSDITAPLLCEHGKRALLSQGYDVDASSPTTIRGAKFFQPRAEHQVQLRITLVCLASGKGSTAYANALQTRSELTASSNSTGLSVTGLGSISLPWTTDKGALTKVGEETISDPDFYRRLFVLIDMLKD